MKRLDPGTLFDGLTARGARTTVHLSRPLDIAPGLGTSLSIGQVADVIRETAGWLAAAGLRPGDRLAICKRNHWDYVLLACAAIRLGAVPALLAAGAPPDAQATMLERLEPQILVSDASVLEPARAAGTHLAGTAERTICLTGESPGTIAIGDLRGATPPPPPPHPRGPGEPLIINHTSGTTGVPKLVVHTTNTVVRRIAALETHRMPVVASRRGDTVACADPFSHGRSLPWTIGVFSLAPRDVVIIADAAPAEAEPVLRAHPPTIVEAPPATFVQWRSLASAPHNVFRDVRLYINTFDAVHPPTIRTYLAASRRRHPLWAQVWGQAETGPLTFRILSRTTIAGRQDRDPTTRDLGRPIPARTGIRVVDPDSLRPLPRGQAGIVMVRTRARCIDYLGERDRWLAKAHGQWWNTGDIGMLTRGGALHLLDRECDSAPGTSCLRLEDIIEDDLPDVLECTILPTPGRPPLPVVVTGDGPVPAEIWRTATAGLPRLADPVTLAWGDLPRTETGKVRRAALRERFPTHRTAHGSGNWT